MPFITLIARPVWHKLGGLHAGITYVKLVVLKISFRSPVKVLTKTTATAQNANIMPITTSRTQDMEILTGSGAYVLPRKFGPA